MAKMDKFKFEIGNKIIKFSGQKFTEKHIPLFEQYYENYKKINKNILKLGSTRKTNLSEIFSEGLYCFLANTIRITKMSSKNNKSDCYCPIKNKFIQIKCSTIKNDCSSFGPQSQFDLLVFIDFSNMPAYSIYEIEKEILENIKVNKNETFKQQQENKRRPRFSIKKSIIEEYDINPVFEGDLNSLEEDYANYQKILNKKIKKKQLIKTI